MNKYVKNFLQRGVAFGGFGPIITGVVFWVLEICGVEVTLSGTSVFLAILSTYVLAFVQAGASVFNQIEDWPIAKSTGLHFLSLYVVYVLCYLLNSWIPFAWEVIAIFTAVFIAVYLAIWLTVYLITKNMSKKMNERLSCEK